MRDHSSCQYCGSKSNLTIDHIIPKQKGGKDSWENLIIACSPCNSRKGNRTLVEANMKLMKVPKNRIDLCILINILIKRMRDGKNTFFK